MNELDELKKFKARIRRIAERNHDSLATLVSVYETGYELEVRETADDHRLLASDGKSLTECINDAYRLIPAALAEWGYLNCD